MPGIISMLALPFENLVFNVFVLHLQIPLGKGQKY
jgi:hypothetical protein